MNDKKIILTVRATQDGYYANYLYKGPIDADEGYTPGEVFQVDATPYIVKDEHGNPVFALADDGKRIPLMDKKGKQILDANGKKMWKVKMASFFAPEWMERVADDTDLTYPDRQPWKIPEAYRIKKNKPVKVMPLPDGLNTDIGIALPASVSEAIGSQPQLEGVI